MNETLRKMLDGTNSQFGIVVSQVHNLASNAKIFNEQNASIFGEANRHIQKEKDNNQSNSSQQRV
jgi:hypothetical protein